MRPRALSAPRVVPGHDALRNPVDLSRRGAQCCRSYGTHPHRRTNAPGSIPVELRRARVPRPATASITRISRDDGSCQCRQPRRALVAPTLPPHSSALHRITRTTSCARLPLGLEPAAASRSPTPTAGGSTPSEPAPTPGIQSGHQHLDNCRDIVVEASATWLRHGSVAPWGAAGCRPAVIPTQGVRFPPGPRCASRLTGRAPGSYPGQDWVRDPGRLLPDRTHAAVAQPVRAAACRAEGHGFESRRWRHVDVAEWRRHRSTKPESAGSTPAVDAQLAVAQWTRAPPSEGGGRTFESCRRGVMSGQALVAQRVERVPGTDEVVGATPTEGSTWKGTGQMRSPFATRVRVDEPVWVRVPPLPLGEAIRPDEGPVPKTGRGREALVGASPTASSTTPR